MAPPYTTINIGIGVQILFLEARVRCTPNLVKVYRVEAAVMIFQAVVSSASGSVAKQWAWLAPTCGDS